MNLLSHLIPYLCCLVAFVKLFKSINLICPLPLKALYLLLALKGLLCSFSWVQQVLQPQRSLLRWFGSATQVNIQIFPCHSPWPMSICTCFYWTVQWKRCCIDRVCAFILRVLLKNQL